MKNSKTGVSPTNIAASSPDISKKTIANVQLDTEGSKKMDDVQKKIKWNGKVVSIQPRSTVWRYLIDNRTHWARHHGEENAFDAYGQTWRT